MRMKKVEVFRFLLTKQLCELQKAADKTFQALRKDERNDSDLIDRAVRESDQSLELMIRNRERLLIRDIHAALERLDEGKFGICESCGEAIAEPRLQAKPTTRLCIHCQATEERPRRLLLHLEAAEQQIGANAP